jgi:hypothetical protein
VKNREPGLPIPCFLPYAPRVPHPRSLALGLTLLLIGSGCASTTRRALGLFGMGTRYGTGITEEELHDELGSFAQRFSVGVAATGERIQESSPDREVRRRALLWMLRMIPLSQQVAGIADPQQSYVGLLTLSVAQRKYLTVGEGTKLFGELQSLAVEEAQLLEERALALGATFLSPKHLDGIRWQVEDVTWAYPIRGVFQSESVVQGFSRADSWGAFDWMIGIPMAPFRALEGVDTGAQSIREFNGTAQEFSALVASLPELLRWQAELLAYDLEGRDTVREGSAAFETLAASSARMAETAERLPAELRAQVADLLQQIEAGQSGLRGTLADLRGGLGDLDAAMARGSELTQSLQRLAEQVNGAGATWQALVSDLRGPPEQAGAQPEGQGFDILEYDRTAARIESAAAELRGLLSEIREARTGIGGILDAALWRLVLLVAACFALRLAFRGLESRLAKRRSGRG